MKLSLINKRLGFKVGNLIYYKNGTEKRYCIITEIINDRIYGNWQNSIETAKTINNDYTSWMSTDRCYNEIE